MSDHEFIFRVGAYSGLDLWLYLLPDSWQAIRVARRAFPSADGATIQVPSGATFKVARGPRGAQATPVIRPQLPF